MEDTMFKKIKKNYSAMAFLTVVALSAIALSACATAGTNTVANMNSNGNAATANATPAPAATLEAREPDRYSVNTTITIQPTGNSPQANIPPLQFSFAKLGADRRVSFKLPEPVGEVIYHELGFQLGEIMSPASAVQRLKERLQYEQAGTETVNGRTAITYRFRGAADTHTQVGTAQADSIVYVDQETGLPLRSEIQTTSSSGAGARIVTIAEGLQFAPDASLFDVPTAMKKVTSAELKQQVQSLVGAVRAVVDYVKQQANGSQPTAAGQQ
jgi:outer membrane lipoprotein-sorting protein